MDEAWKPVPGEGWGELYEVSDHGRIRSKRRYSEITKRFYGGQILKPTTVGRGYLTVTLSDKSIGRIWQVRIHRIVLLAFSPSRAEESGEVRHLDGCPSNNFLSNIVWGTPIENAADRVRHGTEARGERHGRTILTQNDVDYIRRNAKPRGNTQLAKRFGVSNSTIGNILSGKTWGQSQTVDLLNATIERLYGVTK
jgi:hypothetical protein